MKIAGRATRTIWPTEKTVRVIDQTRLPFEVVDVELRTTADAAHAIRTMIVRGAPLIGATAAYGVALAMTENPSDANLATASTHLNATRPTAVNLAWALSEMRRVLAPLPPAQRVEAAFIKAAAICEADVAQCRAIGAHGLSVRPGTI